MALFFMACGEAHTPGVTLSGLKYQTRQHRALLDFLMVEGGWGCGHEGAILSAGMGALGMRTPVVDYDLKLTQARATELLANPQYIRVLTDALDGQDTVYLYGGKLYRETMVRMLMTVGFTGEVVELVGENRGCGDHFGSFADVLYDHSEEA